MSLNEVLLDIGPFKPSSSLAAITASSQPLFNAVARYLALRLGNSSEAEILAGEVFIRAFQPGGEQPPDLPLEAWVFRVARQAALERLRRQNDHAGPTLPSGRETPDESMGGDPSGQSGPLEILRELSQALPQLSADEQEVVALRFGARWSRDKISQALKSDTSTVRRLQGSALSSLAGILAEGHR